MSITVDIISPAGAFTPAARGDTQELTANFTIGSGSSTLQCVNAAPFVAGDSGKYFYLPGAGVAGGILSGTMTFVDSSHVTLSAAASTALSNQSELLTWGHDDAPAFQAFNNWAVSQASPITLTLGSGAHVFLFATQDTNPNRGNSAAYGVPQPLTVVGNGRNSTKFKQGVGSSSQMSFGCQNAIASGTGGFPSTSIYTARLNSAAAGSTSLTCKTIADASLFSNNTEALVTGIDQQQSGSPVNPFAFDFVTITNVNTSTGAFTLQAGLANSYLDNWPSFNTGVIGSSPDQGGPATIYVLDQGWKLDVTWQSLAIDSTISGGTVGCSGKSVKFVDCKSIGFVPLPSINKFVSFTNCDLTSHGMEFDKLVDTCVFDNTSTALIEFQSANNQVIIQNGSTVSLNGTARFTEVRNSTVTALKLGVLGFGRTESFLTSGSTFTGTFALGGVQDNGRITGVLQTDYTMARGVIKIPKAGLLYGCTWIQPGTDCYFAGTDSGKTINPGPGFKVLSVTDDSNFIYVNTDWQRGGFPSWASLIVQHPCWNASFASDTVSSVPEIVNLVNATAAGHTRVGTYTKILFNGGNLTNAIGFPNAFGRLLSYTVDVTSPYSGAQSSLTWKGMERGSGVVTVQPDFSSALYGPVFDLRTSGKRTILPGSAGALGGDSGLSLADPKSWLTPSPQTTSSSVDISGEYAGNNSVGPQMTVTIITSQALLRDIAPARLRLHA